MDAKEFWNNRYKNGGDSGYGSYGEQLQKKMAWLSNLDDIQTIVDVGCGDFNFGSNLLEKYPKAFYLGLDTSEEIININKAKFPRHAFSSKMVIPSADLILCIDVLFHILDDQIYEVLLNILDQKFTKYLAITAYERDPNPNEIGGHLGIRKFDYKRFGEPIIREIVEEDGQMYFYLFKKDSTAPQIDISKVSCCLITKEKEYPSQIKNQLDTMGFGEILIKTESDSPFRKYELFQKAKFDMIYYQDDDAVVPVKELLRVSKPDMINVGMKPHHYNAYKNLRMTMGLGWGSFFNKSVLQELKKYTDIYGEDELYQRDTEKILTHLHSPQNRVILPIIDLPSAMAPDRLSFQPQHYTNMSIIEERCRNLI